MKSTYLWLVTATLALMVSPVKAQNLPTWTAGNTYDLNEVYSLSTPLIGPGGFIDVNVSTRFKVSGPVTISQTKGTLKNVSCWEVDFNSVQFHGQGTASLTAINYNGPIQLRYGHLSGSYYISASGLQTVVRKRNMDAQGYIFNSGQWTPIGGLVIGINEEYSPAQADYSFPMTVGGTWNQKVLTNVFGNYDAIVGNSDYNYTADWNWTWQTKNQVNVSTQEGSCDTYHVSGVQQSGFTVDDYYCPDALWTIQTDQTHLPLGSNSTAGQLNYIHQNVVRYKVVSPATPTPTPMPTQTPNTNPPSFTVSVNSSSIAVGSTLKVSVAATNPGTAAVPADVYVGVEIGKTIYFYPTLQTAAKPWLANFAIPGGLNLPATQIFTYKNSSSAGNLQLTWLGALFTPGTFTLIGNISTAITSLQ